MSEKIKFDLNEENLEIPANFFTKALKNVIFTMMGIEVDESETENDNIPDNDMQISGTMVLVGDKNAVLSIKMSKETAAVLISNMTGIVPYELEDDDIYDGAIEMVNMIAGQAKVFLAETPYHFKLTFPYIVAGNDYVIKHKSKISRIIKKYITQDFKILLEVYYI